MVVLNEKRKEYRVTEELDRQAPMGDRDAANRVASLDAVVRVLNEIDTRAMKTRMEGLERIVGVVSKSLTERATPSTTITE